MVDPSPHPPAPSQAQIDGLLARAHRVRILEGGAARGRPLGGAVLATLSGPAIHDLRAALRVVEGGLPFHCMCHGDLTIDIRGKLLRIAVLSYHHGRSLRLEGASSDVELVDGPALLRLLATRGLTEPLARYQAGLLAETQRADAAERWRAAAPTRLRDRLDELASGPLGLPRAELDPMHDEIVAELRRSAADDRALAAELLAWLGSCDSPWSGHPAYETLPLVLLRRLTPADVLAAVEQADDEARLLGAARFVCDHQIVSFRKRLVAAVSPARFDAFARRLERTTLDPEGLTDARARLRAARAIAEAARERSVRVAAERERELACVAVSEDGPFGGLVTDGERLVALDVYTVVDVDPDTGDLAPLVTYAGAPFTELLLVPDALYVLRNNEGRLELLAPGDEKPRIVAEDLPRPLQLVACGRVVCSISAPFEQYPGADGIHYSRQRTSLVRIDPDGSLATITPVERGVASLAADATHLYFSSTDLEGNGVIARVPSTGGTPQHLVAVKANGHVCARPRLLVDGEHLLYADGRTVCRIPVAGGRAHALARLSGPVAAITPVAGGYVAIVGGSSDEEWHVERIDLAGRHHRVGSLPRAPYDRLALVTRRGQAFFTLADRLYRVR